jgi:ABC-type transport system involved in multi-copper enzyme maturation permease subunit
MKTARSLMGFRRALILVALGLTPAWFFPAVTWQKTFSSGSMSLDMQTSYLAGYFVLITFLWTAGFFLSYLLVGSSGLGMISSEEDRGTLLIMLSKPISRTQLLLGKYVALVVTTLVYELAILFGSITILSIMLGLDTQVVNELIGMVPAVMIYTVLLALLFAALSVLLSGVIRSGPVRGAVFVALLLYVFAAGPIMRLAWQDTYEEYRVHYVDAGYNMGNAYLTLLGGAESDLMTPQGQAWFGITTGTFSGGPGVLLSTFLGSPADFDPDLRAAPPFLERTEHIPWYVSLILILGVAAAALWGANRSLLMREIQ